MENKPFIFGVATSGDNFTDREKETERLLLNFRHGVNTVLISPRRWGKTSLVQKACGLAQSDKLKVVYLDIFSCRNDKDFYTAFAAAILKQTSSKLDEWLENAKLFLSRISPKISIGTDPMTDFSISLEMNPKSHDVDDILQLPERIAQKKGCNIVVCIDEFQQIAEFKDSKTFQKRLRTVWQLQKSVSYCLFGSKKHLMNELFEKKSLPFYKFGDAIYLQKIGTTDWIDYIRRRFEVTGKQISKELAEKTFNIAMDNFKRKTERLAQIANPVIKQVYENQGHMYENILIPITDGKRMYNISCNLKAAYESESKEVVKSFEKSILLHVIDEAWKENLRELDELKHSVQNASYEQKDPLLIYKLESVTLFDAMVNKINNQTISILMRGQIPVQEAPDESAARRVEVRQAAPEQRQDMSKYRENKENLSDPNQQAAASQDTREQQKREPIRAEKTVGRNDPCPCGSGKKYKNCHGKNL